MRMAALAAMRLEAARGCGPCSPWGGGARQRQGTAGRGAKARGRGKQGMAARRAPAGSGGLRAKRARARQPCAHPPGRTHLCPA